MKIFRAVEKGLEIPENLDDLEIPEEKKAEETQESIPAEEENVQEEKTEAPKEVQNVPELTAAETEVTEESQDVSD